MNSGPLPLQLDQVTSEWVSRELSARYSGVEVTELGASVLLDGTATKVRLTLDYNDAGREANLPPTMCLKIGLNPDHFEVSKAIYAAEVHFYDEFAPNIPGLNLPQCFAARTDHETGQSAIFLEDLDRRHVTFGDIRDEPIGLDVVRNLVDWMARLHARFWDDPVLDALYTPPTDRVETWFDYVMEPAYWSSYVKGSRGAGIPSALLDRDNIYNAYLATHKANAAEPQCLNHGDLHAGNLYFEPDGTAGFLDWQGVQRGHWAWDFSYFLVSNLTVEARRVHEKDLLRLYLDRLADYLAEFQPGKAAPEWDVAWRGYRRNISHGTGWIACPTSSQPEEICRLNTDRNFAAAADLGLLEVTGVA